MLVGINNIFSFLLFLLSINHTVYSYIQNSPPIDGILNVYKPYGISSTYVSNRIKIILAENNPSKKKFRIPVGHGGTLDQYAEGVLAIGIGKGTKLLTEFLKGDKEYRCTGTLGFETDTNDLVGKTVYSSRTDHVTDQMLDQAIQTMKGLYYQESPIFSAKKHSGTRLYKYAINNIDVPPKFSLVKVYDIYRIKGEELPNFTLFVRCSGGTYVRSLVRDIGRRLNSRATMTSLVRTKKLGLELKDSLKFNDLNYENILNKLKTVN